MSEDSGLAAAVWDLEPLVDAAGEDGARALIAAARVRVVEFTASYKGRLAQLTTAGQGLFPSGWATKPEPRAKFLLGLPNGCGICARVFAKLGIYLPNAFTRRCRPPASAQTALPARRAKHRRTASCRSLPHGRSRLRGSARLRMTTGRTRTASLRDRRRETEA
jgi:hypothetical protein